MAKYRLIFQDELQDEVFDSYEDAEDYAGYLSGCFHDGGETLELSNPGDYPYDEDAEPEYEIIDEDEVSAYI